MGIPETNVATFWDILDSFKCQGQALAGSVCEGVDGLYSQTFIDVVNEMVACTAILPHRAPYDDLSKPAFVNKDGTPNLKPDDRQAIFSLLVYGDVPSQTQAYAAMKDIFEIAVTWQVYHLDDPNGNAPKCQAYFGKQGGNHGVPNGTENEQSDVSRRLLNAEAGPPCTTVTKTITVRLLGNNWDAQDNCPGFCSAQLPGWKFNGQWRQAGGFNSQCDCTKCLTPAPTATPSPVPLDIGARLADCLIRNGWRTTEQVASMTDSVRRNTIIVELVAEGVDTSQHLQARTDKQLLELCPLPTPSPTPQPTSCETVKQDQRASDWVFQDSMAQRICPGSCPSGTKWTGQWHEAGGFTSYCQCEHTECHPASSHA